MCVSDTYKPIERHMDSHAERFAEIENTERQAQEGHRKTYVKTYRRTHRKTYIMLLQTNKRVTIETNGMIPN